MVTPVGASLFTRKEEQNFDYDWKYVQTGICQLLDIAKRVYATGLCRDHASDIDTVKFAVIQQGQQLGLLIADMSTSRRDFAGKVISTTLYLEFNVSEKVAILNATATLLNPSNQEKQVFLDYAEDLFKNPLGPLKLIQLPKITVSPTAVARKKGLVFFPINERNRYAGYLTHLPDNFCFVSTGYVGPSQYQELVSVFKGGLLVLTLSEEVVKNVKSPLSWQRPTGWPVKKLAFGLIAAVLVLSVSYWVVQKNSTEQQQQLVQQLEKDLATEKNNSAKLATDILTKEQEKSVLQRDLEQQLEQIKKEKEAKIAELTRQIEQTGKEKDVEIANLKGEKTKSDERIKELEGKLASLGQQINGLEAENTALKGKLDQISQVASKENTAVNAPSTNVTVDTPKPVTSEKTQEHVHNPEVEELNQAVEEVNQAKTDLDNFLKGKTYNSSNQSTGRSVEDWLKTGDKNPTYFNKYCEDFSAKRQALQNAIEKNKRKLSSTPALPDNYCEEYQKKSPQKTKENMGHCAYTYKGCPNCQVKQVEVPFPKGTVCPFLFLK
ncbi:MAG: hypothetical protein BWK79_08580 [Beggiatoa sp. IS2]|nr:MAG: hypothetical protein BWK79_08580 [Beggiatoa sp. IS2]